MLRERLQWGPQPGELHDGPRRYLMMRPDVLMGSLLRLDEASRALMLQAMCESTHDNGIDSLRAYAQGLNGDGAALIAATVATAADLGWGQWQVGAEGEAQDGVLVLRVRRSPFVAGWLQAAKTLAAQTPAAPCSDASGGKTGHAQPPVAAMAPVCAPIRGMFTALAGLALGRPVRVLECRCAATAAGDTDECRFEARAIPDA